MFFRLSVFSLWSCWNSLGGCEPTVREYTVGIRSLPSFYKLCLWTPLFLYTVKSFQVDAIPLLYVFYISCAFRTIPKKSLPQPALWNSVPTISSCDFTLSCLTFDSVIRVDFFNVAWDQDLISLFCMWRFLFLSAACCSACVLDLLYKIISCLSLCAWMWGLFQWFCQYHTALITVTL